MIKLYTASTPNGIKIPIALEELGIDYELIKLDLGKRDQKSPDFLRISPNGRIPAIVDEDVLDDQGNPLTIFESGAILLYLAERAEALLGKDRTDRVRTLEWLFFQMGGVGPMFGQLSFFQSNKDYTSKNAIARFSEESHRLASVLETRLQANDWLAGSEYTIADIANYGWMRYAEGIGVDLIDYPKIRQWKESIETRLSVARAMRRLDKPDRMFVELLAENTALGV